MKDELPRLFAAFGLYGDLASEQQKASACILGQGAAFEARTQWHEGLANVPELQHEPQIMSGFIVNQRITGLRLLFEGPCVRHAALAP